MSAGWREPNESIPPELAHKPFHLIKHLRETAMKATSITPEMIKVINSNTVEVTSSNKSDRYKVFLGSENQQPSCQCREFQRSHLLCKHFCAIFKHVDNFSWNSLPDIYKTTPQFIIDTDCANIFPLPNTDQRELQYEEAQQIPDDEQGPEQEPSLTTLDLQRSAKKFREELHRLNNLSYIVDSVEKLDRFRDQLHEMANELTRGCPTSGGLLLEPEQKERKKPASVNRTGHVLKDLPSKRKRKLQVSSVKGRKLKQQTPQVLGLKTNQSNEHDENIPDVNPVKKIKLSSHDKRQNKDDGQTPGKKVKFNFRRTTPQLNIKAESLGKQQNSSRAEEQKLEEIEIRPLLIEYMKTIREHDWENIIVKGNYVGTNLAGRRAGAALEMVKEDGGQLLKDVKNYMPKKFHVSDLCLVEILFMLMARMVNDDVIKLKVDPKDTDKKAHQAIKELLQCLKDSKQPSDVPSCSSIKNSLFATECEENFIKSLKEEGLLKTSTYMLVKNSSVRYEVQGETLEGKDLRTLQESRWLNDKVMNAYMGILKKENNMEQDGHVFVFPSYMAVLWEQNRFDTWFYRKVSLSQYTWIFQPINKCQNHWILLAAHVPEMSVSILDSMAGSNDRYIANWRKYMKMRSAEVGELSGEWTNGKLQSSRQKDGNSCGPFVLMNALALSKGIEPTILSQRSALVMREHVTCKLIQAAKEPKAQRTICDMLVCKKPSKDSWVQCEVCGRWLHFTCIGVKNAPDNDYVCIICNAQYK